MCVCVFMCVCARVCVCVRVCVHIHMSCICKVCLIIVCLEFHLLHSPPPLCGAIPADEKYKCKPSDQVCFPTQFNSVFEYTCMYVVNEREKEGGREGERERERERESIDHCVCPHRWLLG